MSLLSITRDPPDDPALTHASTIKPSWLHRGNPIPPGENSSTLQQQDSAFARDIDNPRMDGILVVRRDIGTASQLQLDESPNTQEWLRSSRIVVLDSPMLVLMADAIAELARGRSESSVGWPESTWFTADSDILVARLDKLFSAAHDETFEDGMNSIFSANLNHIIQIHGSAAVNALERIIRERYVNVAIIEEALRQVGRIGDARTHNSRLFLLEHALESPNTRIRDAASIGIEAMDDPAAVPSLQKAIAKEQYEQLRQNFRDVLAQLQDNQ